MEVQPLSGIIFHMHKKPFINGELYHIYNRGVDKRTTFEDQEDILRFLQSMDEFNVVEPIGSIFKNSFKKKNNQLRGSTSKLVVQGSDRLVDFICYCINPNHYHFVLLQLADGGISEFMKRLSGGYTYYFNNKNDRSGVLFQGRFKSKHIDKDQYLTNLSAYVNLNYRVHKIAGEDLKLVRSSWGEYMEENNENICKKDVVLNYFKNKEQYKKFALNSIQETILRRKSEKTLRDILLE